MELKEKLFKILCTFATLLVAVNSVKSAGDVEFKTSLDSFSQQLFGELFKTNSQKNIIYSPFSIHSCLAMTRMGAGGETATEMDQGLKFNGQTPESVAENYHTLLAKYEDGKMLKIANKVYVKQHTVLEDVFQKTLEEKFYSKPEYVDFERANEAADSINKWVESKTDNKIHNMVSPASLGIDTFLVLVSAIHFKGEWKTKFDVEYTSDQDFFINDSESVKVPMMVTEDYFEYADLQDLDCSVVRLPYKDSDISMLIVLPNSKTGLTSLEEKLRTVSLKSLKPHLSKDHVEVSMPKFEAEFEINLSEPLMNMGMKQMFGRADFTKMKKSPEPLYISSAVHKAFISVTEYGTEASGATSIVANSRSLPIFFTANHPFYYAIINEDFIPIFQGTVVNF
ncbi:antitrypsin [Musca domestica]|uniref:Antitrypsin n=1 Tax=Musca domestica TaxID=7370 RepID=T1PBT0_MUSDO|nr:antitrypsin [Musca domestica]